DERQRRQLAIAAVVEQLAELHAATPARALVARHDQHERRPRRRARAVAMAGGDLADAADRRVAERAAHEPRRRRHGREERAALHRSAFFDFSALAFASCSRMASRSICCGVLAKKYKKRDDFAGTWPMPQP